MRHLVTARFKARDGRRLVPGDVLETDNAERIADLRERRLIGRRLPDPPSPETEAPDPEPISKNVAQMHAAQTESDASDELALAPKHVGGGWYVLPDGRKVQGREAAERLVGEPE